jgi:diguanylate cyclase (GGDEF)-like protein
MKKLLETEVPQLAVDETSLIGWSILHTQYRLAIDVTQVSTRRRHNLLPDTGSELALPLITHGSVIGALSVQTRRLNAFEPAAITIFQTMAAQLSNAIANAKLYQEVEQLAILDSLVGIYNRRHWFELTAREFYRAVRYQKPLSLILLDIDHFKQVNDTYGHPLGDEVLRSLSRICEKNIRTADLVGRYGGEEFLVVLPETDEVEAVQIAERLRLATEEMRVASKNEDVQVTISLGVATLVAEIDTNLEQLVKRADEALYQAKNSGRNRVVLSDPVSGPG